MNNNTYQISTGTTLNIDTVELPTLDLSWVNQESFDFSDLSSKSLSGGNISVTTPISTQGLTTGGITTLNGNSQGTITGIVNGGTGTGINNAATGYGLYDAGIITRNEAEEIIDRKLKPIYRRLAILEEPDARVLERYQSLREAYEHYRTLEGLMYDEIQRIKTSK